MPPNVSCSAKAEHPVTTGLMFSIGNAVVTGSSAFADDDTGEVGRHEPPREEINMCGPILMRCCLGAVAVFLLAASTAPVRGQTPGAVTVFEGARVITGDGSAPIENAAIVVTGDRITAVGRRGEVAAPAGAARVDVTGKTVMPALIDDHVHMGYRRGTSFTPDNYTRENLIDMLDRYAWYGVAAVLETGTGRGDLPYRVRAEARSGARYLTTGSGFGMPNAGPGGPMRDSAFGITDEGQARKYVQELAARKADMVKIWVDDRNGTVEKLKPNLYRAIIDEAHAHGVRVMAHIATLADAKDLLRAGVDGFAHMVRDRDVDEEFLALVKARPNVFFLETLWGERRAIFTAKPAWVDDPALREAFTAESQQQLAEQLSPDPKADLQAVQRGRRRVLRARFPCGTGTAGHQGRAHADAGAGDRNPELGGKSRAHGPRHSRSRQERRFHRPRRQPARRHRQYAAHQPGLSARGGNSPGGAVRQVECEGVEGRAIMGRQGGTSGDLTARRLCLPAER